MDWSNETVLNFIDDYKQNRSLWDTRVPDYKNMFVKKMCLMKLSKEYNCDVGQIKRKIKSLRTAFRREVSKMLSRREIGDATPKWFAYRPMSFLLDNDDYKNDLETYKKNDQQYYKDELNTGDKNENSLENVDVDGESFDSFPHDSNPTSPITVNSQEIHSPSPMVIKRKKILKTRKLKPVKRIRKNINKNRFDTKCKLVKLKSNKTKDEFDYFTKSIATRIRNLGSLRARSYVQYAIGKMLYDAEMGKLDDEVPDYLADSGEINESYNEINEDVNVDEHIIKIEPDD